MLISLLNYHIIRIYFYCIHCCYSKYFFYCKEDSTFAPNSFKLDAIDKPYLKFIEFNVKEKGNKPYLR